METLECIRRCVAVRAFRDELVPDEVLRKVLEAGRLAQSSKNSQPWHFIVVRDRATLRRLSELTGTGPHLARAPVGIVIATLGAKLPYVDATRAIQNMVLAAWDLGLGTCWIANFQEGEVKRLLGLPDEAVLVTAMPFGYPDPSSLISKKRRKSLEEITHWERFGQKAPA